MLHPTTNPISLEGVHRLFLNARIPGFWSSQRTICLPLQLDGSFCDRDPDPLSKDPNPWREVKQIHNYFLNKGHFFANRFQKLKLYPNQRDFERQHCPDWIGEAVKTVNRDIKSYLHVELESREPLLAPFVERWKGLDRVIKGSLYMGSNPMLQRVHAQSFLIYPQDLFLYGDPLIWGAEKPLMGLLLFLEALLSVDSQIRTGIAGQVNVMVTPGRISEKRLLNDPIEMIHEHHQGIEDVHNGSSHSAIWPLELLRPQQTINAKRNGLIEWNQLSSYEMPEITKEYWDAQSEQTAAILGLYLFAENQLSEDEIKIITNEAAENMEKSNRKTRKFTNWFKNFLIRRPKRIDQESLDHQVFLMAHSLKRFIMH